MGGLTVKYTKETYLIKANEKHNNVYTYDLENFENIQSKIKITCKIHGAWVTSAAPHIQGSGCPACGRIKNTTNMAVTKKIKHKAKFREKAIKIHGEKYDYSLVEYENNKTNIKIICKTHGIFEQRPAGHLKGAGCRKCAIEKKSFNREKFIELANKKHNYKYNYDKVIYENSDSYVDIICPVHGIFNQKAFNHYKGNGCHSCAIEKNGWTKSIFKEQCIKNNKRIRNTVYIKML